MRNVEHIGISDYYNTCFRLIYNDFDWNRCYESLLVNSKVLPVYHTVFVCRLLTIRDYVTLYKQLPYDIIQHQAATSRRLSTRNNHELSIQLPVCKNRHLLCCPLYLSAAVFNSLSNDYVILPRRKFITAISKPDFMRRKLGDHQHSLLPVTITLSNYD